MLEAELVSNQLQRQHSNNKRKNVCHQEVIYVDGNELTFNH